MKEGRIFNFVLRQSKRFVQKVKRFIKDEIKRMRQAQSEPALITAQSDYLNQEFEKIKGARQHVIQIETADSGSDPPKHEQTAYYDWYVRIHTAANSLRTVRQCCEESKRYASLAAWRNISDDQRRMSAAMAGALREYCMDRLRGLDADILCIIKAEQRDAAKTGRRSCFQGMSSKASAFDGFDGSHADGIIQAVDKAVPMLENAADAVNRLNMEAYREDLSPWRPARKRLGREEMMGFSHRIFKMYMSGVRR